MNRHSHPAAPASAPASVSEKDNQNTSPQPLTGSASAHEADTYAAGFDRRTFLRTAGSAALFAFLGISLSSCGVTDSGAGNDDNQNGNGSGNGNGTPPPGAIVIEGNTITLNLSFSELENLRLAGGWRNISQARTLVVNVDGSLIRAFSAVCPHAGCADSWQYNNNRFVCTCHNSIFENSGQRVSGPANRNLTEFEVARDPQDENIVVITRS
ncbi:Rieske [2Fe-2S] domain-containing protein [Cyclonatronum proteinivorum]|uniref:Rieske [2Fe-2S] domain-containing protein n=1 Tax=Cyclonatronum proteinivorum TaxID=1457365 RepID=A0A345UNW1_9BACT|nr:Rieske (2Fe-2S) protein [Cyclonatronum proteinivorum]AXJ02163.1 Rieske [2Fe-2S] domain-containing protein [Cyclonatronum proteinivorum]